MFSMLCIGELLKVFDHCKYVGCSLLPTSSRISVHLSMILCVFWQSFSPSRCNGEHWRGTEIYRLLLIWGVLPASYRLSVLNTLVEDPLRILKKLGFSLSRCNVLHALHWRVAESFRSLQICGVLPASYKLKDLSTLVDDPLRVLTKFQPFPM